MAQRGGSQPIPRPSTAGPGDRAPWAGLSPAARRLSFHEVRNRLADLPAPEPAPIVLANARESAVLVPVVEKNGEAQVVLTKRPAGLRTHAGEIAFPGGSRETEDRDLVATALREAREEIGLVPASVDVVGPLDYMATINSGFVIAPFVGLVAGTPPTFVNDPREVDSVLVVPISELLDPDTYREERWDMSGIRPEWGRRAVHFFELPAAGYTHGRGETVWGATARILTRLLGHLTGTEVDGPPALG